ncbi:MAG TPA: hypothetical protein VFK47_19660, partial [Ktedonobacteraceae bacterium]|nr:hypothetical protein [Ktedonobacteraceae bacterium]
MTNGPGQRLKARLLEEIAGCLHKDYQFDKLSASAIVIKAAKVLELDEGIKLTDLVTYRNWSSHARIDRRQGRLSDVVEHVNTKLAKIRRDY